MGNYIDSYESFQKDPTFMKVLKRTQYQDQAGQV
jgi:hypothetical protein